MADQKLVASFDALWFFSNLLSPSPSPPPPTYPRTNPPPPPLPAPPPPPHPKEAAEPHVQTPAIGRDPTAEASTASSIPIPAIAAAPEEAPGMTSRLDQRRTRRRSARRRGLKGGGEQENFDEEVEEVMELGRRLPAVAWRWGSVLPSVDSSLQKTVRVYGLAASGRKSSVSCSMDRRGGDDMAVRDHLRSWAHAVACTVR